MVDTSSYAPVHAKHQSKLLHVSSVNTTDKDPIYGNGRFQVTIKNSLELTEATKLVVEHALLPHVFGNINRYNNFLMGFYKTVSVGGYDYAEILGSPGEMYQGWTSRDEFILGFNKAFTPLLTMQYEAERIGIEHTSDPSLDVDIVLVAPEGLFKMIGFIGQSTPIPTDDKSPTSLYGQLQEQNQKTPLFMIELKKGDIKWGTELPNFSGPHMVYVEMAKANLGGNMVTTDSTKKDILMPISLHNVKYGSMAAFNSNSPFTNYIEFNQSTNIQESIVTILDEKFRPLDIPHNYHVHLVLRLFHRSAVLKGQI